MPTIPPVINEGCYSLKEQMTLMSNVFAVSTFAECCQVCLANKAFYLSPVNTHVIGNVSTSYFKCCCSPSGSLSSLVEVPTLCSTKCDDNTQLCGGTNGNKTYWSFYSVLLLPTINYTAPATSTLTSVTTVAADGTTPSDQQYTQMTTTILSVCIVILALMLVLATAYYICCRRKQVKEARWHASDMLAILSAGGASSGGASTLNTQTKRTTGEDEHRESISIPGTEDEVIYAPRSRKESLITPTSMQQLPQLQRHGSYASHRMSYHTLYLPTEPIPAPPPFDPVAAADIIKSLERARRPPENIPPLSVTMFQTPRDAPSSEAPSTATTTTGTPSGYLTAVNRWSGFIVEPVQEVPEPTSNSRHSLLQKLRRSLPSAAHGFQVPTPMLTQTQTADHERLATKIGVMPPPGGQDGSPTGTNATTTPVVDSPQGISRRWSVSSATTSISGWLWRIRTSKGNEKSSSSVEEDVSVCSRERNRPPSSVFMEAVAANAEMDGQARRNNANVQVEKDS